MKVRDLHPRGVLDITCSDTLRVASKHLAEDDVGVLVVQGARGTVGIFSERDLARAVADDADLDEIEVDEYMTVSPICIEEDAPVEEAIAKMNEFEVRHLVVSSGPYITGVISMRDLLKLVETSPPEEHAVINLAAGT